MTPETEFASNRTSEEKSSRIATWLVVIAVLALVIVMIVYSYADWPGSKFVGIANMKVRHYLELLIVPAALAFGVFWLNNRQDKRDQKAQEDQVERALDAENQRAQDAALEAYLEQMSQLLTDQERPLLWAKPDDTLSVVAWARTKTVLRRMGPARKGNVLRFVNEAGLINKHRPVFRLLGADLRGADLQESYLRHVNLHGADLRGATLTGANLEEVDLSKADLSGADLSNADLSNADLSNADLSAAALTNAIGVTEEQLGKCKSLEGATMPDGQILKTADNPAGPTFEEWLKERVGSGEDGENTSPQ
jgi:hypothetical protein